MAKFQLFKDLRYRRHGVSSFSDIHSSRRPSKEKRDFIDSFWTCRLTLRWGLMYLTKIENQAYCVTWTLTSHAEPYILCTNILFFAAIVLTIYSLFLSSLSCVVSQCRDLFFFLILPSWHCLSLSPTPPLLLLHAHLFRSSVSPRFAVPLWLHSTLLLDCYQPFFVCLFVSVCSSWFSHALSLSPSSRRSCSKHTHLFIIFLISLLFFSPVDKHYERC